MSATAELTERQQEIKALLDDNKTPGEIATALGITENAVYQHIRRMRNNGHKVGSKPRTVSRSRNSRSRNTGTPKPVLVPEQQVRIATPLQAIRARKEVIEHELKAAEKSVLDAERALVGAREHSTAVNKRHQDELKSLDKAEELFRRPALTPAPKAPAKRASARRKAASKSAAKPAAAKPDATAAQEPAA
jgi:IS30 family transposase